MTRLHLGTKIRLVVTAAAIAGMTLGVGAQPAAAGGIRNCVTLTGKQVDHVGCYENVWAGDVEYRMTFSNVGFNGNTPHELDPLYVLAPQTGSPQGPVAAFPHDHVVRDIPSHNGGSYTTKLQGYFVLCTGQGLVSGACVATWLAYVGPAMPFATTVNGEPLTSAAAIESAAASGDVALINLGPDAVLVGTISGR